MYRRSPSTRRKKVPMKVAVMCCIRVSDMKGGCLNWFSDCFDVELVSAPVTYQKKIMMSVAGENALMVGPITPDFPGAHELESPERLTGSALSFFAGGEAAPPFAWLISGSGRPFVLAALSSPTVGSGGFAASLAAEPVRRIDIAAAGRADHGVCVRSAYAEV